MTVFSAVVSAGLPTTAAKKRHEFRGLKPLHVLRRCSESLVPMAINMYYMVKYLEVLILPTQCINGFSNRLVSAVEKDVGRSRSKVSSFFFLEWKQIET